MQYNIILKDKCQITLSAGFFSLCLPKMLSDNKTSYLATAVSLPMLLWHADLEMQPPSYQGGLVGTIDLNFMKMCVGYYEF